MIQSVMLIVLGFLLATLLALLVAPIVWRRAAQLESRRLIEGLPVSIQDFNAEKDQLRADHARALRTLEIELAEARDKAAEHMVEIGRQKAENMTLANRVRELRKVLSERKSQMAIMEQTLSANVPRMKERLEAEIGEKIRLTSKLGQLEGNLAKTTRQLEEAERSVKTREVEIGKLRHAIGISKSNGIMPVLKKPGAGRSIDISKLDLSDGKAVRIVKQLQNENDQLREIIEKTRAQLAQAKAFEAREAPALRKEMHKLGTDVLRAAQTSKAMEAKAPAANSAAKVKKSLAERLRTIKPAGKIGNEADA